MQEWLAGYRTYIAAAVLVGMGVAQAFGIAIPEAAWIVVNGLGLGALRAAVK